MGWAVHRKYSGMRVYMELEAALRDAVIYGIAGCSPDSNGG